MEGEPFKKFQQVKSYEITSFGRATLVGPAFQPFSHPLTFTLLHKETSVWISLRKLFHSQYCCSQHTVPRNIKLAQTPQFQGTNSHLGRVEPRRFISCAQRNSLWAIWCVQRNTRQACVGFELQPLYLLSTTGPMCPDKSDKG